MSRFRKKPVEVEARQFLPGSYKAVSEWCSAFVVRGVNNKVAWIEIQTLEGNMRADVGDWIIRGVQGEFYPCKPDIFEATYEPAAPAPATESGQA